MSQANESYKRIGIKIMCIINELKNATERSASVVGCEAESVAILIEDTDRFDPIFYEAEHKLMWPLARYGRPVTNVEIAEAAGVDASRIVEEDCMWCLVVRV